MAGPTSVRFCNEMLELCGYQEDALNEWKQRIQEGDRCTREQYIQIEKEQQALEKRLTFRVCVRQFSRFRLSEFQ